MEDMTLDRFAELRVLVSGDFMMDEYIMGNVRRISPEAPVPVVEVEQRERRLGGAGNVICNLVSLGAGVRALSCLGEDEAGRALINGMKKMKVDTRFLLPLPGRKTSLKTRIISKGQQFLRYDEELVKEAPEALADYVRAHMDDLFEGIDVVILSDYGKGNLSPAISRLLIDEASDRRIPVVVDPKGKDYGKYAGATVCTPNMQEFILASGALDHPNEEELHRLGLDMCKKLGFPYLLVTRSEQGMTLLCQETGEKKDFPAIKKEVVDVTGAGDTVIAVFSLAMAAGCTPEDCCRLANRAASVVISKFGAAVVMPEELRGQTETGRKILTQEEAALIARQLRKQGRTMVFTNGCFDLIHAGHITSLEQAKSHGDVLIVGLNSDESVRRLKGAGRPVIGEENRARLLGALAMVDYVVLFDEDTPEQLIRLLLPDVLVKGQDWSGREVVGEDIVKAHGGRVELAALEQGLSTTRIIEKIRKEGAV